MYTVMKDGKHLKSIRPEDSYDKVRNALRRYIRRTYSPDARLGRDIGNGEFVYYNPSHTQYGYRIVRVPTYA